MRDFSEQSCKEALENIYALLSRTLLLRGSKPVDALINMLEALNYADMLLAARAYHDMVSALLEEPVRRVSGDLWCDYLFHVLLETPHAFARMAAAGEMDEAQYKAMCNELSVLGALSTLTGTEVVRMLRERHRELQLKTRQAKDDISLVSTAIWSGAAARTSVKSAPPQNAVYLPGDIPWLSWRYGDSGLRDEYVSDEALEEIYARLLSTSDWSAYAEDIRSFFAAYGCGAFIRSRVLCYTEQGEFLPLPARVIAPLPQPIFYPKQHERIMENTLRFMQGEPAQHLLLTGCAGSGKTAQVLCALYEFPEARLVLARDISHELLRKLSAQPLRFIVLLDDVSSVNTSCMLSGRAVSDNVVVYATTRGGAEVFPTAMRIDFPPAQMRDFSAFVLELLNAQDIRADESEVRSACIDWQMDSNNQLTPSAALQIAYRFSLRS